MFGVCWETGFAAFRVVDDSSWHAILASCIHLMTVWVRSCFRFALRGNKMYITLTDVRKSALLAFVKFALALHTVML